jgi:hypothetical protein
MVNFRAEPYLWIHLAGIAVVPLTLQLAWVGLSLGDPLPWYGLELAWLGAIALLPILWMQVTRPFDFFSLGAVVLKPDTLSLEQRRTLSRLKTGQHRILSLVVAIAFGGIAWQLYQLAPLATPATLGVSHLFLQVPASVLAILLLSRERWLATPVYEAETISLHFAVIGWQVSRLPLIPTVPSNPETSLFN